MPFRLEYVAIREVGNRSKVMGGKRFGLNGNNFSLNLLLNNNLTSVTCDLQTLHTTSK